MKKFYRLLSFRKRKAIKVILKKLKLFQLTFYIKITI